MSSERGELMLTSDILTSYLHNLGDDVLLVQKEWLR